MKHLLSLAEWQPQEINEVLDLAITMKKNPDDYREVMKHKTLMMIFEKPSLRTRVSFEVGATQLGGHAIYYDVSTSPLGKKETIEDTAKCSGRFADVIMARMFHFSDIKALADNAGVPVIDALSEQNHPCQIMADLQTIKEKKGELKGLKIAYFGDCENNVTYSLLHGAALTGMNIDVACPENEEVKPKQQFVDEANEIAKITGSVIRVLHDAAEAAKDADVIYTDSWMSYHVAKDREAERKALLMPFQVNADLMKHAKADVLFMNCLPAMRGYEQTAEVIDGPQSIVFDQAENRLHAQKAILKYLLDRI
ncbi:MAG: ornithine carbamoyltransferase [Patescibacteria group bacterium]